MTTVGDFLIDRLYRWGVRRIFGYPGDGINGIIAAIDRFQRAHDGGGIDFIKCGTKNKRPSWRARTRSSPANRRLPGHPRSRSGSSAQRTLRREERSHAGVRNHRTDRTSALGSEYQQEVDLPSLFKDVASEYSATVVARPGAARGRSRRPRGDRRAYRDGAFLSQRFRKKKRSSSRPHT